MTARKASTRRDRALYRMVFEQARDSMMVLELPEDGEPRVVDANPAALALHGLSRAGLVGKPVSVLGASLSRRGFRPAGGGGPFEVVHERADGGPLVTEVTARNVRADGRLYGILIERDVTWRRDLEEEGRKLSARIMQEREAEKKRLSAGLHDGLGAMQVGLSSELLLLEESVRRGEKRKALAGIARARGLLRESGAGLKKFCVESWPQALDITGLEAALSELLAGFSRRSGIKVSQQLSVQREGAGASCPEAIILYRLAQEALANVERHSRAGMVFFSAAREGAWLTLEVRDDGRGFRTADCAGPDCLGLKIMADAASAAGGYFSVYSSPGKGATVKARLPLGGRRGKK